MPSKRMMKTVIHSLVPRLLSDPERGDEEVDGFTEQEIEVQGLGEGEGGREEGLNSALVHKLFSQHPHLYNRQYPEIPDSNNCNRRSRYLHTDLIHYLQPAQTPLPPVLLVLDPVIQTTTHCHNAETVINILTQYTTSPGSNSLSVWMAQCVKMDGGVAELRVVICCHSLCWVHKTGRGDTLACPSSTSGYVTSYKVKRLNDVPLSYSCCQSHKDHWNFLQNILYTL